MGEAHPSRATAGVTSAFIALFIVTWFGVALFYISPKGWVLPLVAGFGCMVAHALWLRNAWNVVPPGYRYATPGKAVEPESLILPLCVPFLNVYWAFKYHVGLCENVDAMLMAYGAPPQNKRGFAVLANVFCCCAPLLPIGLVLMAWHMRSMDRVLGLLEARIATGWPNQAPQPPTSSYVLGAWPAVIVGFLITTVASKFVQNGQLAPRRGPELYVTNITLAQRLATGIMQCRADRGGDLPPSSTKLVPPEDWQVKKFQKTKEEDWLADPTFACAKFAPTDAPGWRVTWQRVGPQLGTVHVRDYRGEQSAKAIISCGEEGCRVRGEPPFHVVDPTWGTVTPKADADSPPVPMGPVAIAVKPALTQPIRPENASLLEELSGVEMLGTPGAKLSFPDGGQLLAQSPSPNVLIEEPAYEPRRLLAKIEDGGVLDVTGAIAVASSAYVIAILDRRGDVWIAKDYPTPKVKRSCGAGATRVALTHGGQFLVCGKDRPEHIFAVRKR